MTRESQHRRTISTSCSRSAFLLGHGQRVSEPLACQVITTEHQKAWAAVGARQLSRHERRLIRGGTQVPLPFSYQPRRKCPTEVHSQWYGLTLERHAAHSVVRHCNKSARTRAACNPIPLISARLLYAPCFGLAFHLLCPLVARKYALARCCRRCRCPWPISCASRVYHELE